MNVAGTPAPEPVRPEPDHPESGHPEAAERHASWAELFFDLVAIAGVGTLAHVLAEDLTPASLGLYSVLFLTFWLTWTTFMLYGNVAAGNANIVRLLVGMFGLGVMAASVPGVTHAVLAGADGDQHSRALTGYALAYVLTRWFGSQSWRRCEVLLDFPVVQHLTGTVPWLVSVFVHGPARIWLWVAGVVLDLVLMMVVSGRDLLRRNQERPAATGRRSGRRSSGPGPVIRGLSVDPGHLDERLGLFVLIVLGESVIQLVEAASEADYSRGLLRVGLVSFLLLSAMFALSVVYGHAGLPHLREGALAPRAMLALHWIVTGAIATIAVSLTAAIEHGAEPLPQPQRWLLCGAVAVYFALGLIASWAASGFRAVAALAWVLTGIAAPLLLGLFARDVAASALVGYVALVAAGHVWLARRLAAHGASRPRAEA